MAAYADLDYATSLYGAEYINASIDRDGDDAITAADTDLAEAMFDVVTAEMNSYFVGRVSLPLANPPLDLKMRCVDIFIYRMCTDAGTLSEIKKARFEAAIAWLTLVATNKVKLTTLDGSSTGANAVASARLTTAAYQSLDDGSRRFSRSALKDVL
jgi:phage gp36-like protein